VWTACAELRIIVSRQFAATCKLTRTFDGDYKVYNSFIFYFYIYFITPTDAGNT